MCGFAGILAWDPTFAPTRDVLERMGQRIAHRGPDAHGLYLSGEATRRAPFVPQCGLVHRRLAVIDPLERATQPFRHAAKKLWLAYNGEIYNFRELRSELAALLPEYQWRTECDTEVLLLALDAWKVQALERLNGMFAFALWDESRGELLLARDRMGQKPLYYALVDGGGRPFVPSHAAARPAAIAFASELSALRELPWFDRTTNAHAATEYLRWGYVAAPMTIYTGAAKLPPATWLRVGNAGFETATYFDANTSTGRRGFRGTVAQAVRETRRLVVQAVRRQLVADVPMGCFLSGGIDSSIIAATACRAMGDHPRLRTFSIGFEDRALDESPHAAAVAHYLGTAHETFIVRPHVAEELPKIAAAFGEPCAAQSAIAAQWLSREVRQRVKVALGGDGGDELFGGYQRYRAMLLADTMRRLPRTVRHVIGYGAARAFSGARTGARPLSAALRRLTGAVMHGPSRGYPAFVRVFDEPTLRRLMGDSAIEDADTIESTFALLSQGYRRDSVQSALAVDRVSYLPDNVLTKVDRTSMLHGLEVRSPFMDHELVTFACGLPAEMLVSARRGKRLLSLAFDQDVPASVFRRRKAGFVPPIGRWLRRELRPMLNDLLFSSNSYVRCRLVPSAAQRLVDEHQRGEGDHAHRLYALLMLELWWRAAR